VEGCLVKRQDNQIGFTQGQHQKSSKKRATIRNSRIKEIGNKRGSRKMSFIYNLANNRKIGYKKIESNGLKAPIVINYEQDNKPYECKKNCMLFQFYKS
jgi:hypothetical protein